MFGGMQTSLLFAFQSYQHLFDLDFSVFLMTNSIGRSQLWIPLPGTPECFSTRRDLFSSYYKLLETFLFALTVLWIFSVVLSLPMPGYWGSCLEFREGSHICSLAVSHKWANPKVFDTRPVHGVHHRTCRWQSNFCDKFFYLIPEAYMHRRLFPGLFPTVY